MEEKTICTFSIVGALFSFALGSVIHFIYDWFPMPVFRVIGTVSESTWEHLKLLVYPILLFSLIEYLCYGRKLRGFFSIKIYSVLLGMVVIVTAFYTYTGVIGDHFSTCDIAVFALGILAAYIFSCVKLQRKLAADSEFSYVAKKPDSFFDRPIASFFAFLFLLLLIVCFICFSFYPPDIALFLPPKI